MRRAARTSPRTSCFFAHPPCTHMSGGFPGALAGLALPHLGALAPSSRSPLRGARDVRPGAFAPGQACRAPSGCYCSGWSCGTPRVGEHPPCTTAVLLSRVRPGLAGLLSGTFSCPPVQPGSSVPAGSRSPFVACLFPLRWPVVSSRTVSPVSTSRACGPEERGTSGANPAFPYSSFSAAPVR